MTYKNFTITLAKDAGKIMLKNFSLGMKKHIKKDGSPVTKTDLAINKMVVDRVAKYFPEHGVLGEEQSNIITGSIFTWVCDPVDGTIPFSHGMPTCMFSLALCQYGVPVLGVGYDPFLDRLFFAEKGKGAFLNGKKIHVSNNSSLKDAYVSIGLWRSQPFPTPGIVDDLLFKQQGHYFGMGSIVYNACLMAAGELDGVILGASTAHDVAAVDIIVREAGGKTSDYFGKNQAYDRPVSGWIGSNGKLQSPLIKLVRAHLKK